MLRKELVIDRSGRPIIGCDSGRGVKIFLSAGAHGDEPAGVMAALRVIAKHESGRYEGIRLRRVPIRDPAGHVGFLTILRELTEEEPPREYKKLREFLASREKIYDDGTLLLVDFDRVVIALAPPEPGGEDAINERIERAMREEDVFEALRGRYIFMPANQPKAEGVGLYDKGFTSYVSKSGRLGNYNRFFGDPEAPKEVKAVQEFLDEFRPEYTIDMHEGYADCFYVVIDEIRDGIDRLLAKPKTSLRVCSYEELREIGVLYDGIVEHSIKDSLSGYARRYGRAITTETGLEARLNSRRLSHLQAFERLLEVKKYEESYRSVERIVEKTMKNAPSDHGLNHVRRVRKLGIKVAKRLRADVLVVDLAALLHDIYANVEREKHAEKGAEIARKILSEVGLSFVADRVAEAIRKHSRSSRNEEFNREELSLKIADLLDAIGFIGSYRAIAYGARIGRDEEGFIKHAEEKLLKIYDRIASHTSDERILAEAKKRHEELKEFVERLKEEAF